MLSDMTDITDHALRRKENQRKYAVTVICCNGSIRGLEHCL